MVFSNYLLKGDLPEVRNRKYSVQPVAFQCMTEGHAQKEEEHKDF